MIADPCPDYVSLIVRAADDSLDAAGRSALDTHVATCTACREALTAQTMAHAALASRVAVDASPAFRARVMEALEAPAPFSWLDAFDFRRWTWRLAPVTAAAALAAYFAIGAARTVPQAAALPAATDNVEASDQTVASALMLADISNDQLMSLMLFASPDAALASALKETPQ